MHASVDMPKIFVKLQSPDKKPPKGWPTEGAINFSNLYLKYVPDGNYVLQKINISIQPHEKVQ